MPTKNPTNFHHTAMATEFEARIRHEDPAYARQAAAEIWREIDRIETLISHFNESSDISRINAAPLDETLRIADETHALLLRALELQQLTNGAFDITLGAATAHLRRHKKLPGTSSGGAQSPGAPKNATQQPAAPTSPFLDSDRLPSTAIALTIDPENPLIQKSPPHSPTSELCPLTSNFSLDLGAIGKGYALDTAGTLLAEWEIPNALLNAGGSSILALGSPSPTQRGWTINLLADTHAHPLTLRNHALGSSGTSQQGAHIINPRRASLEYLHHRTWFIAPDAATADALSTAALTMTHDELFQLLEKLPANHAAITESHQTHELHLITKKSPATLITPETTLEWL